MSGARRFFADNIGEKTVIEGEEFRHAVSVLRISVGDEVVLLDNSGFEYDGVVESVAKKSLTVAVNGRRRGEREPNTFVRLICGHLKGDKTEYVVQKAVELGVSAITVFYSRYCSAYMNENKLARLNKVAAEAAKQCGRSVAPRVEYADSFDSALASGKDCDNKIFACEFASENAVNFAALTGSTCIVIGSEGGFSEEEFALAERLGFATAFFGKRILRADTACVAALAVVMYSLGEMK